MGAAISAIDKNDNVTSLLASLSMHVSEFLGKRRGPTS
jgi:hypothetical protein